MSKKKKKHKKESQMIPQYITFNNKEKKNVDKKFRKALSNIESMQMELYEADKKHNKKERKTINKRQKDFYTSMESIKCRQTMARNWEKSGWLDNVMELLHKVSPYVKMVAKGLCILIISFLSIDAVAEKIKPETVKKLTVLFNVASTI